MFVAVLLLISAAILLVYNTTENTRVEEENLEVVTELEKIFEEKQEEQLQDENQEPIENVASININGNNYIGIVYIPILDNLALPVIDECNKVNLKISICKYSGSIESGNFVIAGHNYKASFGKLSKLAIGNIAYFKDANGAVYKYKCKAIEVLTPNQVEKMNTGDWDLTLFTCTYNNVNRLACRFELE